MLGIDVNGGLPREDRHCTNIFWVIPLLATFIAFAVRSSISINDGRSHRLYFPRDFRGDYCGDDVTRTTRTSQYGVNLLDHKRLAYTMNISTTVDAIAENFVCTQRAADEFERHGLLTNKQTQARTSHCRSRVTDTIDNIKAQLLELTDLTSTALFSSGSTNVGLFEGIWGQATESFVQVCASTCDIVSSKLNRRYTYRLPPDTPLAEHFQILASDPRVSQQVRDTVGHSFSFRALPENVCPYPARYCVPFPGTELFELGPRQCEIHVSKSASKYIDTDAEDLEALAGKAWRLSQASLGAGMDGFMASFDSFVITAVAGIVLGFLFLVFLRFLTRLFVIASFFAIIVFFWIVGLMMIVTPKYGVWSTIGTVIAWAFGLVCVYFFCTRKRQVELAIELNKVALEFVHTVPRVLLVSFVSSTIGVLFFIWWGITAASHMSIINEADTPYGHFADPGSCPDGWLGGFAWKDFSGDSTSNDLCRGNKPRCWRCAPPRIAVGAEFVFNVVIFFWYSSLILGVSQFVTASASATWFFTPGGLKGTKPAVKIGLYRLFRYHIGSLSMGSLAIVVTWPFRVFLALAQRLVQANNNLIQTFCCIPICLLGCPVHFYQKHLRHLTRDGYIQMAISGNEFCESARNAVFLLMGNFLRFGALSVIKSLVSSIIFGWTLAATTLLGYLLILGMHPGVNLFLPMVLVVAVGYLLGKLYSSVIDITIRSTLQCTMLMAELDDDDFGDSVPPDCVPPALRRFVPQVARNLLNFDAVDDASSVLPLHTRMKGNALKEAMQKLLDETFQDRNVPGKHTAIHLKVLSVECMENQRTMKSYYACRDSLKSRRQKCVRFSVMTDNRGKELAAHCPMDPSVNESWFFHGTSEEAAKSILRTDFRLPKTHTHGGIYGSGVYVAESNSKAHSYCTEDATKGWPMLVVRTTLGLVNNTDERFPDKDVLKQAIDNRSYDSVCGDRRKITNAFGGWREFIVYDVDQVLSEYLVWVKQK